MITFAMVLFAFTTLLGNLFYVDNCLAYLNGGKTPSKSTMTIYRIIAVIVIFVGAGMSMDNAWALADITMAFMCLTNIPSIMAMNKTAIAVMKDYGRQLAEGKKYWSRRLQSRLLEISSCIRSLRSCACAASFFMVTKNRFRCYGNGQACCPTLQ